MHSPLETLMTPAEAAKALNSTYGTLAVWRCKGRGPAFQKVGSRVFYRLSDIQKYLDAGRVTPRPRD